MKRNDGVKKRETTCMYDGRGESRRWERTWKGVGGECRKRRENSLVIVLKTVPLDLHFSPGLCSTFADVAIIQRVFALSTLVMRKMAGMWGLTSSCNNKKS